MWILNWLTITLAFTIANGDFIGISLNKTGKRVSTDRQSLLGCNGSRSLLGTSRANPIVIQSPNFPQNYPTNIGCLYSMAVPANSQLNIEIFNMDMDCPWDYVALSTDNSQNVLTLCPLESVLSSYYLPASSSSYTFRISFFSGNFVTYTGFNMIVYLSSATTPPPTTATTTTARVSSTTARTTTTRVSSTTARTTTATTTRLTSTTGITVTTTTRASTTTSAVCRCGNWGVREADRIVGGFIAPAHAFPYQVGIWPKTVNSVFCGGTLISTNYVLTAAHCVINRTPDSIRVAVNDVNYQIFGDGEFFVNVMSIVIHPQYNVTAFQDNDFALLKLSTKVAVSSTVNIACLPPDVTQTFENSNMTISGWGYTVNNGALSPNLKYAFVNGWNNAACKATGYGNLITDNMLCASTPAIDTDACQGDSGGPMVATVNGRVSLVGVVSFGGPCGQPPYPGIYARVTKSKSWILANSDAGLCQN